MSEFVSREELERLAAEGDIEAQAQIAFEDYEAAAAALNEPNEDEIDESDVYDYEDGLGYIGYIEGV